jgi:hypothetical protein
VETRGTQEQLEQMASLLDVLPPEIIYYCFGNVFQVHHIVVASQGSVVKRFCGFFFLATNCVESQQLSLTMRLPQ